MKDFSHKLAVITGGGSGMGRELALALAAEGCALALCDVSEADMAETARLARERCPELAVSTHVCDVSDEAAVLRLSDEVASVHHTGYIHLLFNNAGIGGGGSLFTDSREEWDRTFGVCWGGVYHCTRAFLPMLERASEAHIVNTSSINGFWASLGRRTPHTAYSAAKFAVKGFSEALLTDLAVNAPHIAVSVVMPGHVGTGIVANTGKAHGREPEQLTAEDLRAIRERLLERGLPVDNLGDEQIREWVARRVEEFRTRAPTSAAEAAGIILDGVRDGRWRILVGDDAHAIDEAVRADPESAYSVQFLDRLMQAGHFQGLFGGSAPR